MALVRKGGENPVKLTELSEQSFDINSNASPIKIPRPRPIAGPVYDPAPEPIVDPNSQPEPQSPGTVSEEEPISEDPIGDVLEEEGVPVREQPPTKYDPKKTGVPEDILKQYEELEAYFDSSTIVGNLLNPYSLLTPITQDQIKSPELITDADAQEMGLLDRQAYRKLYESWNGDEDVLLIDLNRNRQEILEREQRWQERYKEKQTNRKAIDTGLKNIGLGGAVFLLDALDQLTAMGLDMYQDAGTAVQRVLLGRNLELIEKVRKDPNLTPERAAELDAQEADIYKKLGDRDALMAISKKMNRLTSERSMYEPVSEEYVKYSQLPGWRNYLRRMGTDDFWRREAPAAVASAGMSMASLVHPVAMATYIGGYAANMSEETRRQSIEDQFNQGRSESEKMSYSEIAPYMDDMRENPEYNEMLLHADALAAKSYVLNAGVALAETIASKAFLKLSLGSKVRNIPGISRHAANVVQRVGGVAGEAITEGLQEPWENGVHEHLLTKYAKTGSYGKSFSIESVIDLFESGALTWERLAEGDPEYIQASALGAASGGAVATGPAMVGGIKNYITNKEAYKLLEEEPARILEGITKFTGRKGGNPDQVQLAAVMKSLGESAAHMELINKAKATGDTEFIGLAYQQGIGHVIYNELQKENPNLDEVKKAINILIDEQPSKMLTAPSGQKIPKEIFKLWGESLVDTAEKAFEESAKLADDIQDGERRMVFDMSLGYNYLETRIKDIDKFVSSKEDSENPIEKQLVKKAQKRRDNLAKAQGQYKEILDEFFDQVEQRREQGDGTTSKGSNSNDPILNILKTPRAKLGTTGKEVTSDVISNLNKDGTTIYTFNTEGEVNGKKTKAPFKPYSDPTQAGEDLGLEFDPETHGGDTQTILGTAKEDKQLLKLESVAQDKDGNLTANIMIGDQVYNNVPMNLDTGRMTDDSMSDDEFLEKQKPNIDAALSSIGTMEDLIRMEEEWEDTPGAIEYIRKKSQEIINTQAQSVEPFDKTDTVATLDKRWNTPGRALFAASEKEELFRRWLQLLDSDVRGQQDQVEALMVTARKNREKGSNETAGMSDDNVELYNKVPESLREALIDRKYGSIIQALTVDTPNDFKDRMETMGDILGEAAADYFDNWEKPAVDPNIGTSTPPRPPQGTRLTIPEIPPKRKTKPKVKLSKKYRAIQEKYKNQYEQERKGLTAKAKNLKKAVSSLHEKIEAFRSNPLMSAALLEIADPEKGRKVNVLYEKHKELLAEDLKKLGITNKLMTLGDLKKIIENSDLLEQDTKNNIQQVLDDFEALDSQTIQIIDNSFTGKEFKGKTGVKGSKAYEFNQKPVMGIYNPLAMHVSIFTHDIAFATAMGKVLQEDHLNMSPQEFMISRIVHEVTHAHTTDKLILYLATEHQSGNVSKEILDQARGYLTDAERVLLKEYMELFELARKNKDKFRNDYAVSNPFELITEYKSDPTVRADLKKIIDENQNINLYQKIKNWFRKWFNRGEVKPSPNAVDQLLDHTMNHFDFGRRKAFVDDFYMKPTKKGTTADVLYKDVLASYGTDHSRWHIHPSYDFAHQWDKMNVYEKANTVALLNSWDVPIKEPAMREFQDKNAEFIKNFTPITKKDEKSGDQVPVIPEYAFQLAQEHIAELSDQLDTVVEDIKKLDANYTKKINGLSEQQRLENETEDPEYEIINFVGWVRPRDKNKEDYTEKMQAIYIDNVMYKVTKDGKPRTATHNQENTALAYEEYQRIQEEKNAEKGGSDTSGLPTSAAKAVVRLETMGVSDAVIEQFKNMVKAADKVVLTEDEKFYHEIIGEDWFGQPIYSEDKWDRLTSIFGTPPKNQKIKNSTEIGTKVDEFLSDVYNYEIKPLAYYAEDFMEGGATPENIDLLANIADTITSRLDLAEGSAVLYSGPMRVFSRSLGFAGTPDAVMIMPDGKFEFIDFKTMRTNYVDPGKDNTYPKYNIKYDNKHSYRSKHSGQLIAYSFMAEEAFGIENTGKASNEYYLVGKYHETKPDYKAKTLQHVNTITHTLKTSKGEYYVVKGFNDKKTVQRRTETRKRKGIVTDKGTGKKSKKKNPNPTKKQGGDSSSSSNEVTTKIRRRAKQQVLASRSVKRYQDWLDKSPMESFRDNLETAFIDRVLELDFYNQSFIFKTVQGGLFRFSISPEGPVLRKVTKGIVGFTEQPLLNKEELAATRDQLLEDKGIQSTLKLLEEATSNEVADELTRQYNVENVDHFNDAVEEKAIELAQNTPENKNKKPGDSIPEPTNAAERETAVVSMYYDIRKGRLDTRAEPEVILKALSMIDQVILDRTDKNRPTKKFENYKKYLKQRYDDIYIIEQIFPDPKKNPKFYERRAKRQESIKEERARKLRAIPGNKGTISQVKDVQGTIGVKAIQEGRAGKNGLPLEAYGKEEQYKMAMEMLNTGQVSKNDPVFVEVDAEYNQTLAEEVGIEDTSMEKQPLLITGYVKDGKLTKDTVNGQKVVFGVVAELTKEVKGKKHLRAVRKKAYQQEGIVDANLTIKNLYPGKFIAKEQWHTGSEYSNIDLMQFPIGISKGHPSFFKGAQSVTMLEWFDTNMQEAFPNMPDHQRNTYSSLMEWRNEADSTGNVYIAIEAPNGAVSVYRTVVQVIGSLPEEKARITELLESSTDKTWQKNQKEIHKLVRWYNYDVEQNEKNSVLPAYEYAGMRDGQPVFSIELTPSLLVSYNMREADFQGTELISAGTPVLTGLTAEQLYDFYRIDGKRIQIDNRINKDKAYKRKALDKYLLFNLPTEGRIFSDVRFEFAEEGPAQESPEAAGELTEQEKREKIAEQTRKEQQEEEEDDFFSFGLESRIGEGLRDRLQTARNFFKTDGNLKEQDFETTKAWAQKVLRDVGIVVDDKLIEAYHNAVAGFGARTLGYFGEGMVILSSGADSKVLRHEVFHVVMNLMLSPRQYKAIIAEARQDPNIKDPTKADIERIRSLAKKGTSEERLEEIFYEEQLADKFMSYNNRPITIAQKIKAFFQDLIDIVKSYRRRDDITISRLYRMADRNTLGKNFLGRDRKNFSEAFARRLDNMKGDNGFYKFEGWTTNEFREVKSFLVKDMVRKYFLPNVEKRYPDIATINDYFQYVVKGRSEKFLNQVVGSMKNYVKKEKEIAQTTFQKLIEADLATEEVTTAYWHQMNSFDKILDQLETNPRFLDEVLGEFKYRYGLIGVGLDFEATIFDENGEALFNVETLQDKEGNKIGWRKTNSEKEIETDQEGQEDPHDPDMVEGEPEGGRYSENYFKQTLRLVDPLKNMSSQFKEILGNIPKIDMNKVRKKFGPNPTDAQITEALQKESFYMKNSLGGLEYYSEIDAYNKMLKELSGAATPEIAYERLKTLASQRGWAKFLFGKIQQELSTQDDAHPMDSPLFTDIYSSIAGLHNASYFYKDPSNRNPMVSSAYDMTLVVMSNKWRNNFNAKFVEYKDGERIYTPPDNTVLQEHRAIMQQAFHDIENVDYSENALREIVEVFNFYGLDISYGEIRMIYEQTRADRSVEGGTIHSGLFDVREMMNYFDKVIFKSLQITDELPKPRDPWTYKESRVSARDRNRILKHISANRMNLGYRNSFTDHAYKTRYTYTFSGTMHRMFDAFRNTDEVDAQITNEQTGETTTKKWPYGRRLAYNISQFAGFKHMPFLKTLLDPVFYERDSANRYRVASNKLYIEQLTGARDDFGRPVETSDMSPGDLETLSFEKFIESIRSSTPFAKFRVGTPSDKDNIYFLNMPVTTLENTNDPNSIEEQANNIYDLVKTEYYMLKEIKEKDMPITPNGVTGMHYFPYIDINKPLPDRDTVVAMVLEELEKKTEAHMKMLEKEGLAKRVLSADQTEEIWAPMGDMVSTKYALATREDNVRELDEEIEDDEYTDEEKAIYQERLNRKWATVMGKYINHSAMSQIQFSMLTAGHPVQYKNMGDFKKRDGQWDSPGIYSRMRDFMVTVVQDPISFLSWNPDDLDADPDAKEFMKRVHEDGVENSDGTTFITERRRAQLARDFERATRTEKLEEEIRLYQEGKSKKPGEGLLSYSPKKTHIHVPFHGYGNVAVSLQMKHAEHVLTRKLAYAAADKVKEVVFETMKRGEINKLRKGTYVDVSDKQAFAWLHNARFENGQLVSKEVAKRVKKKKKGQTAAEIKHQVWMEWAAQSPKAGYLALATRGKKIVGTDKFYPQIVADILNSQRMEIKETKEINVPTAIDAANGFAAYKRPILAATLYYMEQNNMDAISMKSAVKNGAVSALPTLEALNYTESFREYGEFEESVKSIENIGETPFIPALQMVVSGASVKQQQPSSTEIHDSLQSLALQMKRSGTAEIKADGIYTINGKEMTGKEVRKLWDDMFTADMRESWEEVQDLINDDEKLRKRFKEFSLQRGEDETKRRALDRTSFLSFAEPFYLDSKSKQAIMTSWINKGVMRPKILGPKLYNNPSLGYSDELEVQFKEDGTLDYIPVYMPPYSRKFYDKDGNLLSVDEIQKMSDNEDWRRAVFIKMPYEGSYSMLPVRIEGWTPPEQGPVIVLPADIATKTGHDYDIDTMYGMFRDIMMRTDPDTGEQKLLIDRREKSSDRNATRIDIIEEIARKHTTQVMAPQSTERLEKALEELGLDENSSSGTQVALQGEERGWYKTLTTIMSGGQTGIDQLALQVAKALGIRTGGYVPGNWKTEEGKGEEMKKQLSEYGLKPIKGGYTRRTEANIQHSDGTILFGDMNTAGSISTLKYIKKHGKPYLINPTAVEIRQWLEDNEAADTPIKKLNVAGNSMSKWRRSGKDPLVHMRALARAIKGESLPVNPKKKVYQQEIEFGLEDGSQYPMTQAVYQARASQGNRMIGIFAALNGLHGIIQNTGTVKFKHEFKMNGHNIKDFDANYEIGSTWRTITRNLGTAVGASADAAKDDTILKLNFHPALANELGQLYLMGYDEETIVAFMNFPIIREYTKLLIEGKKKRRPVYQTNKMMVNKLSAMFAKEIPQKEFDNLLKKELSMDSLITDVNIGELVGEKGAEFIAVTNRWNNDDLTAQDMRNQFNLFKTYLFLQKRSSEFGKLRRFTTLSDGKIGSDLATLHSIIKDLQQIEKFEYFEIDGLVPVIDSNLNIVKEGKISHLNEAVKIYLQYMKDMNRHMPFFTATSNGILDSIKEMMGSKGQRSISGYDMADLYSQMINYQMQTLQMLEVPESFGEVFIDMFNAKRQAISEDAAQWKIYQPFFDAIEVQTDRKTGKRKLKLPSQRLVQEDREKASAALEEMLDSEEHYQFVKDFFNYGLLLEGFSPGSILQLLPKEFFLKEENLIASLNAEIMDSYYPGRFDNDHTVRDPGRVDTRQVAERIALANWKFLPSFRGSRYKVQEDGGVKRNRKEGEFIIVPNVSDYQTSSKDMVPFVRAGNNVFKLEGTPTSEEGLYVIMDTNTSNNSLTNYAGHGHPDEGFQEVYPDELAEVRKKMKVPKKESSQMSFGFQSTVSLSDEAGGEYVETGGRRQDIDLIKKYSERNKQAEKFLRGILEKLGFTFETVETARELASALGEDNPIRFHIEATKGIIAVAKDDRPNTITYARQLAAVIIEQYWDSPEIEVLRKGGETISSDHFTNSDHYKTTISNYLQIFNNDIEKAEKAVMVDMMAEFIVSELDTNTGAQRSKFGNMMIRLKRLWQRLKAHVRRVLGRKDSIDKIITAEMNKVMSDMYIRALKTDLLDKKNLKDFRYSDQSASIKIKNILQKYRSLKAKIQANINTLGNEKMNITEEAIEIYLENYSDIARSPKTALLIADTWYRLYEIQSTGGALTDAEYAKLQFLEKEVLKENATQYKRIIEIDKKLEELEKSVEYHESTEMLTQMTSYVTQIVNMIDEQFDREDIDIETFGRTIHQLDLNRNLALELLDVIRSVKDDPLYFLEGEAKTLLDDVKEALTQLDDMRKDAADMRAKVAGHYMYEFAKGRQSPAYDNFRTIGGAISYFEDKDNRQDTFLERYLFRKEHSNDEITGQVVNMTHKWDSVITQDMQETREKLVLSMEEMELTPALKEYLKSKGWSSYNINSLLAEYDKDGNRTGYWLSPYRVKDFTDAKNQMYHESYLLFERAIKKELGVNIVVPKGSSESARRVRAEMFDEENLKKLNLQGAIDDAELNGMIAAIDVMKAKQKAWLDANTMNNPKADQIKDYYQSILPPHEYRAWKNRVESRKEVTDPDTGEVYGEKILYKGELRVPSDGTDGTVDWSNPDYQELMDLSEKEGNGFAQFWATTMGIVHENKRMLPIYHRDTYEKMARMPQFEATNDDTGDQIVSLIGNTLAGKPKRARANQAIFRMSRRMQLITSQREDENQYVIEQANLPWKRKSIEELRTVNEGIDIDVPIRYQEMLEDPETMTLNSIYALMKEREMARKWEVKQEDMGKLLGLEYIQRSKDKTTYENFKDAIEVLVEEEGVKVTQFGSYSPSITRLQLRATHAFDWLQGVVRNATLKFDFVKGVANALSGEWGAALAAASGEHFTLADYFDVQKRRVLRVGRGQAHVLFKGQKNHAMMEAFGIIDKDRYRLLDARAGAKIARGVQGLPIWEFAGTPTKAMLMELRLRGQRLGTDGNWYNRTEFIESRLDQGVSKKQAIEEWKSLNRDWGFTADGRLVSKEEFIEEYGEKEWESAVKGRNMYNAILYRRPGSKEEVERSDGTVEMRKITEPQVKVAPWAQEYNQESDAEFLARAKAFTTNAILRQTFEDTSLGDAGMYRNVIVKAGLSLTRYLPLMLERLIKREHLNHATQELEIGAFRGTVAYLGMKYKNLLLAKEDRTRIPMLYATQARWTGAALSSIIGARMMINMFRASIDLDDDEDNYFKQLALVTYLNILNQAYRERQGVVAIQQVIGVLSGDMLDLNLSYLGSVGKVVKEGVVHHGYYASVAGEMLGLSDGPTEEERKERTIRSGYRKDQNKLLGYSWTSIPGLRGAVKSVSPKISAGYEKSIYTAYKSELIDDTVDLNYSVTKKIAAWLGISPDTYEERVEKRNIYRNKNKRKKKGLNKSLGGSLNKSLNKSLN